MNGRKETEVEIEKIIDNERREKVYESYEPTKSELDNDNPPAEDSESESE